MPEKVWIIITIISVIILILPGFFWLNSVDDDKRKALNGARFVKSVFTNEPYIRLGKFNDEDFWKNETVKK